MEGVLQSVLCVLLFTSISAAGAQYPQVEVVKGLADMPLAFTENQGQWDESILFRADARGTTMWFTRQGVHYQFVRRVDGTSEPSPMRLPDDSPKFEQLIISTEFVGANSDPTIVADGVLDFKCNFFLGNDRAKWRINVSSFSSITYKDLWPGIDLKYFDNGKEMEYELVLAPGADPRQIKFRYEGTESLTIDESGSLVAETGWAKVMEPRPHAYQQTTAHRNDAVTRFVLENKNVFTFHLPFSVDPLQVTVIDPVLRLSTYRGGGEQDIAYDIAVRPNGESYVAGVTASWTPEPPDLDVIVERFSADGSRPLSYAIISGSGSDYCYGIAVDQVGNAYITGMTGSSDFPTMNAFDSIPNGPAAFVTKLSSQGTINYSTFLDGSAWDAAFAIAVDPGGFAYILGSTWSSDFPTVNAYDSSFNGGTSDVFVSKVSPSGSALTYSTYLGGSDLDETEGLRGGIVVDPSGSAYITGSTCSPDFPIRNAYQATIGGVWGDAFVTKLTSSGSDLVYSTFLGGSSSEVGVDIVIDPSNQAIVTGETTSDDFPVNNAYDSTWDVLRDVFVTKLSSNGNSLVFSTYIGGGSQDRGLGCVIDAAGSICVTGITSSLDFPTVDAYQGSNAGSSDAFLLKLRSDGAALMYGSYFGGSQDDYGHAVALDAGGNARVVGSTNSANFPVVNPINPTYGGQTDQFLLKVSFGQPGCTWLVGDANGNGVINIPDVVYLISYIFSGGPAPTPHPVGSGDANCSYLVSIADVTYLVNFIFTQGSPPPGNPDNLPPADCTCQDYQ